MEGPPSIIFFKKPKKNIEELFFPFVLVKIEEGRLLMKSEKEAARRKIGLMSTSVRFQPGNQNHYRNRYVLRCITGSPAVWLRG